MKIKVSLNVCASKYKENINKVISQKIKINKNDILDVVILKRSIDARKKDSVRLIYSLIVTLKDLLDNKKILNYREVSLYEEKNEYVMQYTKVESKTRPVIVGFGPSGIFASLYLARCGLKPIIIERGSDVDKRIIDVDKFLKEKVLDENSNIQFGEGGAGTFSDGKLTTNLKDPLNKFILEELVRYGANKEILFDSMPHIGTDVIRGIVKGIREEIISLGGNFYFNTLFTKFDKVNDDIKVYATKGNEKLVFDTNNLILALGHSAYDTITYLHDKGLSMEPKPFSMGVRIEHLQKDINKLQYSKYSEHLPNATYKMAIHLNDRSMYSFCMCPGGYVMASSSINNHIVTNGMSYQNRDNVNANSALLVNVDPKDYYKDSALDGFKFMHKYEKLAFDISKDFKAPGNLVKEFLNDSVANDFRKVKPSYNHGVILTDLSKCLPDFVNESLKEGLNTLKKRMPGFVDDDAVLTGIETRSSSPVRIIRNELKESSISNIYPIGEGAGFAGGIMSAALDGLKCAMSIVENIKK